MQKLREWVETKPAPVTPQPPGPPPPVSAAERDEHLAHAAADLKHAATDVKEGVKSGARNLRDEVATDARQAKGAVMSTVGRVAGAASSELDRLRSKAELEAEHARKNAHAAKESLRDKEIALERRIKHATANKIFLDKRAPYYRDVCADYDVTFSQPALSSKRLVLSTPDLLENCRDCSMQVSTVHDSEHGNEQLAATFDWEDTFGQPKLINTLDRPLWERPQNVALSSYLALPMASAAGKPVLRLGMDVTDELTDYSVGGFFKQSGAQWLAGYKSRVPYLTLAGYVKSDAKVSNRYMMSTAFASTLFRDTARGSSLTGGLQVDSTPFTAKAGGGLALPDSVGSVTAKAEYDEPSFNFDMKMRASMYTNSQNNSQGFKISDAFLRGMYVFNAGQYPRSVVGATVGIVDGGVIGERDALNVSGSVDESASGLDTASVSPRSFRPYGDPDVVPSSTLARLFGSNGGNGSLAVLNKPVAQVHWYHSLNPRNKVKVSLSSERALHSSFTYQLLQNVSVSTSLQSAFPRSGSFIDSVSKGGIKNSMGIAVSIGAY